MRKLTPDQEAAWEKLQEDKFTNIQDVNATIDAFYTRHLADSSQFDEGELEEEVKIVTELQRLLYQYYS
jgi:hypothetical protein